MLKLPESNGLLVESFDELPNYREATDIVADYETSSGDPKKTSVNPWHNCSVAGLAISAMDDPKIYYIPRKFYDAEWVKDTFRSDVRWRNHNIKYDANVQANAGTEFGHMFKGELWDTLTGSKLVNSDRFVYSLDSLSREWLKTPPKAKHLLEPYLKDSQDYGDVPDEVLGDYACYDVRLTKLLAATIERYMPEESEQVWKTERDLTSILFNSEQRGIRVIEHQKLLEEQFRTLNQLFNVIGPALEKENDGVLFEPHISNDCYEVLHVKHGLPILEYTEKGNPSFSHHVLNQYLAIPNAPHSLLKLCLEWKTLWQYHNLYIEPYLVLGVDDIIHPSFNQCVRTGRMACSMPNMQQLNKKAKTLIIPREGNVFLSIDYSQIEFRVIVHYIKNRYALDAYNENPDTDFHTWVAEMVGIPRRPAKNVNFMLAFGGGKKKTLSMLQDQPDLMNEIRGTCDTEEAFKVACKMRANEVYSDYHGTLPELKQTSRLATTVAKQRGYVRNHYGRRRVLTPRFSYKAFNTLCQSTAADLAKERAVALAPLLDRLGGALLAMVHDEFLIELPESAATENNVQSIVETLQSPARPLRVPIRCSVGSSVENWAACGG